jgi:hypothetical protein
MEQVTEKIRPPAADELAEKLAALAERRRDAIRRAFTRLHPLALGCGVGFVAGAVVLVGTLVLVARGGPNVGANLQALSSYFPGYQVTVPGAFVGGSLGFAVGFLSGYALAAFRNLALQIVLAYARWSAEWWRRRHMLDEI